MLARLERQLQRKPKLSPDYSEFLQEYKTLGHMALIPPTERMTTDCLPIYLPYQVVIREGSLTTQV